MDAKATNNSQPLALAPGVKSKSGRKDYMSKSRSWWGNPQRQLTQASRSSWTLDWQLGSMHGTSECGWQLYVLVYMWYCWKWYRWGMNWFLGAHSLWWDTMFRHNAVGEGIMPASTLCARLVDYPWEPLSSLRSGWDWRNVGESRRRRERKNCGHYV